MERLLRLTAFHYTEYVWWRLGDSKFVDGKLIVSDPDTLHFFVNCNDVFEWGTADLEPIDDDADIEALESTVWECEAIRGYGRGEDGFMLWVARKRGMRPQGAMYKHIDRELWHLFDAVGPERELDMLNPKPKPEAST